MISRRPGRLSRRLPDIRQGAVVISRIESPRAGWADAAAALNRNGGGGIVLDRALSVLREMFSP